jgi:hypothetical protein
MSLRGTIRSIVDCNLDQITVQVEFTLQVSGANIIRNITLTKNDFYLWRESAPASNNTILDYATFVVQQAYGKLAVLASAGTALVGKTFTW